MLSREDTDLLCRVTPGTPMGDLMRQYWLPVTYDWELEVDGQPQRVRVLGEDLVAWRSSDGTPAFTQARCPHRGAGLYFGRNEEGGLRCAYHGWKYDVTGRCIDMPNEPATSNFKNKLSLTAYRGTDFGGISWIYMGPRQDDPPGVPRFEWGLVPQEQRRHYRKSVYAWNWMQSLEGEMDSTHVYFLHSRLRRDDPAKYGTYHPGLSARFHMRDTDFGMTYAAQRQDDEGTDYWRTTHFLFPIYGMFPGTASRVPLSIYTPIDDEHTLHWGVEWSPSVPLTGDRWPSNALPEELGTTVEGMGPMRPEQKGKFFSSWWPEARGETDFLMDLEAKKKSFTGIPSVRLQDAAVLWSMGPIMDRTLEHLGTSDAAIIRVRRKLIAAARQLHEHGTVPPGVDEPELYTLRTCNVSLPRGVEWEEALGDWHHARTNDFPTATTHERAT